MVDSRTVSCSLALGKITRVHVCVWRRGEEKCMSGEMEPGQRVLQGSVLSRKVSLQAILKLNGIVFGRRDWKKSVGRILVS